MKLFIDPSIIKKYDLQGPRYTSYPPVPNFDPNYKESNYINYLQSNSTTKDISLYFHLPFCKSLCYYCGCNVFITSNQEIIQNYLEILKKEVYLTKQYLPKDSIVKQLHWGGGTPNYLNNEQIRELFYFIQNEFFISPNAEISIELDPRTTQKEQLFLLKELGFNRISFGVQDLNKNVQKAVNRVQPVDVIEELYAYARDLNFYSINMDFIYGLPEQNSENFIFNLKKILEWKPDRLAFFSYAHVPWVKKHQNLLSQKHIPNSNEKILIFKQIVETLTNNDYVYIGLDHFAKPEDELAKAFLEKKLHRNFQGYTVLENMDVLAFGITAISQLQKSYVRNLKSIKDYKERIKQNHFPILDGYMMNEDDLIRRDIIQKIMCNLYVDFKEIERQYNIDFKHYFSKSLEKLQELERDGLVEIMNDSLHILSKGRPLIRNAAMCFDAFLEKKQTTKTLVYSKTI